MGKYVERSMLPVFRYCRVMEDDDFDQLMEDYDFVKELAEDIVSNHVLYLKKNDEKRLKALLNRFYLGEYQDLIFTDQMLKGRFQFEYNDETKDTPKKYLLHMLSVMMDLFQMSLTIRTMQGEIFLYSGDKDIYPKLFLITEEFYTPFKKNPSMDFYDLFRLLPAGVCFNTFIQGSLKECKYGVMIWRGNGDIIKITLLDPFCADYDFILIKAGEHSYSLASVFGCTLKNKNRCERYRGVTNPCVNSFDECPTKKLQVVHAVLLCMQEYLIKKNIQNRNKKQSKSKKNTLAGTEKLHMDGMIAVYDYFSDKDYEKVGIRERSESSCTGTKKRPHVRSGHERHLRSGDVVNVKSSIIHKDDFSGYETGERIAK